MDRINAGLIGFGTVGTGVYKVLKENQSLIKNRLGMEVVLKKIADKDIERDRGVRVEKGVFTTDVDSVINDPDIDIIIELIGGIDSAKEVILKALKKGKHVVTANKALLSMHGREIFECAEGKNLNVGFEASVGGGIPIIKALREGLAANEINSIYGIINGTANYILSKMTNEGLGFEEVLKEAQSKGYAEKDPTFDVEGIDAAHKLAILINLSFATYIKLEDIYTEGIRGITPLDVEFSREFGYKIKLLAIAKNVGGAIEARVHPTMIPLHHPLSGVDGVYNAIHIAGNAVGNVMFYGKGAGEMPTASAVAADIVDISRDIIKGKGARLTPLAYARGALKKINIKKIAELESSYYIRFSAIDRPGALSKISGVLGSHNISISSVIQKGRHAGYIVPLVIVTHNALERGLDGALEEIKKLDVVVDRPTVIRIMGD